MENTRNFLELQQNTFLNLSTIVLNLQTSVNFRHSIKNFRSACSNGHLRNRCSPRKKFTSRDRRNILKFSINSQSSSKPFPARWESEDQTGDNWLVQDLDFAVDEAKLPPIFFFNPLSCCFFCCVLGGIVVQLMTPFAS